MSSFVREGLLQAMLAESPDLLELGEPVAVVREMRVPGVGKVDLVAVGLSGQITLIECKLAENPEIRRSVVGQVFAYAAGLWARSYDEFDSLFAARTGRSLAAAVAESAGVQEDWDEDAFRRSVGDKLEKGQFDLFIAVDGITDELKRVVSYLNEHTVSEIRVLALELDYRADDDVEILVPKLYGQESATRKTRSSARGIWDEESFFGALAQECPEGEPVIRRLYDHAVDGGGDISWGGGVRPSLTVSLTVGTVRAAVWRCRTDSPPRWVLLFDWMQRRGVSPERMQRLVNRLGEIPGVADELKGAEASGWRTRSRIPVSFLATPEAGDRVVFAIEEFLDAPHSNVDG
ncbi:MAG: hypothetical protein FWD59_09230 [Micrococcales bacterium]|nr:hypothetical protein [Micrococcales bacterium]